jgi:hypothetical protein
MDILPNFLIVGASKSGTSSLYHYLKQHPDIFLSERQKEGRFFSQMKNCFEGPGDTVVEKSLTKDQDTYKKLFIGHSGQKAVGDISPEYLYFHENAVSRIKSMLGDDVKIIIILRNPVDRAYSSYTHFKRDHREDLSFEEALEKEQERKKLNWLWAWQYKNSGLYYSQVKAYIDNFKHVQVIVYDDLIREQDQVLADICNFIGVRSDFKFDTSYKYNVSGDPKNQILYKLETSRSLVKFVKRLIPKGISAKLKKQFTGEKQMVKTEMNPQTRKELIEFFSADIVKLEQLIGQDLSHWLNGIRC